MAITDKDIEKLSKVFATKKDLDNGFKRYEKRAIRRENKNKKEILTAVAKVALNSPTLKMHFDLEKKVDKLLKQ